MNIGEASDLNTLVANVLDLPGPTGTVPPDQDARAAAARLAGRAHAALKAGLTADAVLATWPILPTSDTTHPDAAEATGPGSEPGSQPDLWEASGATTRPDDAPAGG